MAFNKIARRAKIKNRVRGKISGTSSRPRLTVYRSNAEIYAQVIDDENGVTIASASSLKLDKSGKNKVQLSEEVGKSVAALALEKGVENVVFDRNGYLYHGRVLSLAEGARQGGLKF
jgi:large subunit ribosomal protein L18